MMLTPISYARLPRMIRVYDVALADTPGAQAVFRRITESRRSALGRSELHRAMVDLASRSGMDVLDAAPSDGFSWDGRRVATRTEPAVLIHEIAHWLTAPDSRRMLPDFGLGAGPETGQVADADAVRCVADATREREEDLASLLGILLEAELHGPAFGAFCEQNWFELYDRPGTQAHFIMTLEELRSRGLVDGDYRPVLAR